MEKKIRNINVSVYENNGLLQLEISPKFQFPIKVELEYKERVRSAMDIKRWIPVSENDICVLNASLKLSYADASLVDIVCSKLQPTSEHIDEDEYHISIWELNNFTATKKGNSSELPFVKIIKNR